MKFIGAIKSVIFLLSMTGFGLGMFPEIGDRPHGAFAFACLSIAILVAWTEVSRSLNK